MPRRRPDLVHEYRVSLSDYERARLNEAISTAQANVALDTFTNVLQSAGTALAGAGSLLAAFVLLKWKAPEIINDVKDVVVNAVDVAADTILPGTPVEFRRQAQDLAVRRGNLAREQTAFCTFSASTYDEGKCSQFFVNQDKYFEDLRTLRLAIRASQTAKEAAFIYYGLGDIAPRSGNVDDY